MMETSCLQATLTTLAECEGDAGVNISTEILLNNHRDANKICAAVKCHEAFEVLAHSDCLEAMEESVKYTAFVKVAHYCASQLAPAPWAVSRMLITDVPEIPLPTKPIEITDVTPPTVPLPQPPTPLTAPPATTVPPPVTPAPTPPPTSPPTPPPTLPTPPTTTPVHTETPAPPPPVTATPSPATWTPAPPAPTTAPPPPTTAPPPPVTEAPAPPPPVTEAPAPPPAGTPPPPAESTPEATPVATTPAPSQDTNTTASETTATPNSTIPVGTPPITTRITAPPTNASALATSPPASNARSDSSGMSSGTVIAWVAGGLLFIIGMIVLLVYARSRRRKREEDEDMDTIDDSKFHIRVMTPRTAGTTTTSDPWGGSAIATSRIPLEKITLGPVISQGGYGEVLRGLYKGEEVAVKRLLSQRRKDLGSIHNFLEEIKITATLEHECIVKFIGVAWDAPSDLCMISELMTGGDLRSLLTDRKRRQCPNGYDEDKLRIGLQVAHALTYLHSLQPVVVHRDLKSRNILLTSDLNAKLLDFGVSTQRRDSTMTAGVGTSLWMAPEVMMGERYDEKADVFSFGVVLSEMDTHELPYEHARESESGRLLNDMVVMQLVSQGRLTPRFTRDADPDIVDLAHDCLQLDASRRPTSADVLYRMHRVRRSGSLISTPSQSTW